ncbi:hypothetical protein S819_17780 [Salmonella enterica]|nr:hypothetical protein [Salmonella enterica]
MSIDIDIIKARAKNEYRLSKVRGEAMISVRIPGGILPAHLLTVARDIAETWDMGHLIDKGGYLRFKERVLRGVQLNPEAMVAERIYWAEDESVARMHLKPAGH